MEKEEPRIRLVPYNLNQVFKLKRELTEALDVTYRDCIVDAEGLSDVVAIVCNILPGKIQEGCVRDSLRHLAGVKLDRRLIRTESWRLAGNIRSLKAGTPVPPWRVQRFQEWVPLQITDCKLMRTPKRKKLGALFTFRVLAGRPCTQLFNTFWSQRFCQFFAAHSGFSSRRGDIPFSRMEEFVRLRFYGLLKPVSDKLDARNAFDGRSLIVEQYYTNSSFEKFNKAQLRQRARLGGFKCPRNYKHACHQCPVGYDLCPAAVHPRTYEKHECDVCGNEHWFDPMWVALGICVDCQRKRDMSNHEHSE